MAEDKLEYTVYHSEQQRRSNFDKYVHKQPCLVFLEGWIEHGHVVSIHVRRFDTSLVDGIKTDKFDAVKTRITSVEMLRSNFEASCPHQDYMPDFLEERILLPSALSVANDAYMITKRQRERRAVNRQMSQSAMQLKKTSVADDDSTLFSRTPASADEPATSAKWCQQSHERGAPAPEESLTTSPE
ncbi:hypothetical protein MHU86_18244 [Fragilaria crotonensis]|nr:hypothetical protein MHU86_18244 [Fragilaria crotonensis]